MSGGDTGHSVSQPEHFAFTPENLEKAKSFMAKYPEGRQASAVIACLDLAQRQAGGWLPTVAMDHVASVLDMAPIRVYEVATFYTMFNLKPVGDFFIQVCRTTPCWLRGSDALTDACKKKLGVGIGEVSADGKFSVVEVECLGACVNAPMVQINDDYYEDLTPDLMESLIDRLAAGEAPAIGSQTGRQGSAPEGGPTVLLGGGDD